MYMYVQKCKAHHGSITKKVLFKCKTNRTNYSDFPYQNLLDCGRLGNSTPNLSGMGLDLILCHGKCIDLDLKHRAETQGKEKKR